MNKKLLFIFTMLVSGIFANDSVVDFGNYDIMSTFQPSYTDPVQMISMSSYDWDDDDDDDEDDDDYKSPYSGGGSGYEKDYCGPAVPEPSTYALFAGMIGLGYAVYRRKKKF
jgi:hypothetical protein